MVDFKKLRENTKGKTLKLKVPVVKDADKAVRDDPFYFSWAWCVARGMGSKVEIDCDWSFAADAAGPHELGQFVRLLRMLAELVELAAMFPEATPCVLADHFLQPVEEQVIRGRARVCATCGGMWSSDPESQDRIACPHCGAVLSASESKARAESLVLPPPPPSGGSGLEAMF